MTHYLLDTNTVSYLIRRHPEVSRRVSAVPMAALYISCITEGELLFGLAKRPAATHLRALVEAFLRRVEALAWHSGAAAHYGPLRAELEGRGQSLSPLDMLIAAQAAAEGAILVTSDRAFTQVRELMVEDWT